MEPRVHAELASPFGPSCYSGHGYWGCISIADKMNFLRLADLFNIQVVTINIKRHLLEAWIPQVYQLSTSLLVQKMVWHGQVRRGSFLSSCFKNRGICSANSTECVSSLKLQIIPLLPAFGISGGMERPQNTLFDLLQDRLLDDASFCDVS